MKKGDKIPAWIIAPKEVEEPAAVVVEDAVALDEQDDDLEVAMVDENDDEVVFLQEVPAQERNDSRMDDDAETKPIRQVEVLEEVNEFENNKDGRDSIENENLKERVEELIREKEIVMEKMKAYQSKNEMLEAKLAREKTTAKHWKSLVDIKQRECNDTLKKMEDDLKHTKHNLQRMTAEYEFLRNIYTADRTKQTKQERLRVTRRYARDKDFEAYGKNHK